MRRHVMIFALAGTAACSYLFELPSTGESSSGGGPLGGPDASLDAFDRSLYDGPVFDPFDASPPFCATRDTGDAGYLFCADFDDREPPNLATLGTSQTTNGAIQLANVVSVSSPRSISSITNGPNATASFTVPLGSAPNALTFSFAMLVSRWDGAAARLARVAFGQGLDACFVRLEATSVFRLTQSCQAGGVEAESRVTETSVVIDRGAWHSFTITVSLTPPKTITLDVDGVRAAEAAALDAAHPAPTSITFGVEHSDSGTIAMFQDDVLVTTP